MKWQVINEFFRVWRVTVRLSVTKVDFITCVFAKFETEVVYNKLNKWGRRVLIGRLCRWYRMLTKGLSQHENIINAYVTAYFSRNSWLYVWTNKPYGIPTLITLIKWIYILNFLGSFINTLENRLLESGTHGILLLWRSFKRVGWREVNVGEVVDSKKKWTYFSRGCSWKIDTQFLTVYNNYDKK